MSGDASSASLPWDMRLRLTIALSALTSLFLSAGGCTIITVGSSESDGSAGTTTDSNGTGEASTAGTTGTSSEGSDTATHGSNSGTQGTSEGSSDTGTSTGAETTGEVDCTEGCGADEYCDWHWNSCGDGPIDYGTCKPKAEACDAEYDPVCGCDGEIHSNACNANAAGTDLAAGGGCPTPPGLFDCGYRFCDSESSYCLVVTNDLLAEPDDNYCQPLPEACQKEKICACLEGEPCFGFPCTDDGGLILECSAG